MYYVYMYMYISIYTYRLEKYTCTWKCIYINKYIYTI